MRERFHLIGLNLCWNWLIEYCTRSLSWKLYFYFRTDRKKVENPPGMINLLSNVSEWKIYFFSCATNSVSGSYKQKLKAFSSPGPNYTYVDLPTFIAGRKIVRYKRRSSSPLPPLDLLHQDILHYSYIQYVSFASVTKDLSQIWRFSMQYICVEVFWADKWRKRNTWSTTFW